MQDREIGTYEPGAVQAPRTDDRVIEQRLTYETPATGPYVDTRIGQNVMTVRDRVRWGPIAAGLATTITSMLVLSVLGLAIGLSAFEPGADASDFGTEAAIWSAISALVSFFVGGWVAAKTAAVGGEGTGILNGFMVGAAALVLILWLTTSGLTNLVGGIGSNLAEIADVATAGATTGEVQEAADEATGAVTDAARGAYDDAEEGAWGTLAGLVLALAAASLGGWVGHNKRQDLIEGTG